MIAEKDLRIGNWVLDDEGQPVQIEVIKSRDFVKYDEDPEQFIFLKNGDFGWCREVNGIP
jgi:chorismate-pyruvate lyase